MSEQRDRNHEGSPDERERGGAGRDDRSPVGRAGEAGRGLADAATGAVGLASGLLGELAGALDGLVGGLAGDSASKRRTQIHPWELPSESDETDQPDADVKKRETSDVYDEDYDRIR